MADLPTRRLVVLRHAKAEQPGILDDHERALTGRGRRDARAAGEWLAGHGLVPELVVCSTARRARETWDGVQAGLGAVPEVRYEPGLYAAPVARLLQVLWAVPDTAVRVLLVGHNPGVHELVQELAAPTPVAEFPTAALAVLDADVPWSALAGGAARLADLAVPRG